MKKDILIIGTECSGKTTLTNAILDKYGSYEPLRGDATLTALSHVMPKKTKDENNVCVVSLPILTQEEILEYLVTLYEELRYDLLKTKRNIIIDTFNLSVEEAYEKFGETCDIYCLGMPNEDAKELEIKIRETETSDDWTYSMGHFSLEYLCKDIIDESQKMQEECQKYDIDFLDMSGNRKEAIKKSMEVIEKKSILID